MAVDVMSAIDIFSQRMRRRMFSPHSTRTGRPLVLLLSPPPRMKLLGSRPILPRVVLLVHRQARLLLRLRKSEQEQLFQYPVPADFLPGLGTLARLGVPRPSSHPTHRATSARPPHQPGH